MTTTGTLQRTTESELEQETLAIQLSISTMQGEKFIDELEKLCDKFSNEGNYFFNFK